MNGTLSAQNASLEAKLGQFAGKLQGSVITNQRLLQECISFKKRYEDSENKLIEMSRDHERHQRWMNSHQHIIKDYEKYVGSLLLI